MQFPWDDEAERAQAEQRAYGRAQRRGIGAALHREIPREAGEPFVGIFLMADESQVVDVLVHFPEWPTLCETAAQGNSRWILERAVEDELLTHACRTSEGIGGLAAGGGAVLTVRPLRAPRV